MDYSQNFRTLSSQVLQSRFGCVVPAHSMCSGTRRGRGRAQVSARDPRAVRIDCHARTQDNLQFGVGTSDDVAAYLIRIVLCQVSCTTARCRDDLIPESWRKPLDLTNDRLCSVAGISVWHVRIGVQRMNVPGGSGGISQLLLTEEHERPVRHAA